MPKELLDAGQGFIAMDPPRHTKIRRLLAAAFTPKQLARIDDHIVANARRIVDDIADKGEIDFARGRRPGPDAQHLRHGGHPRGAPPHRRP